MQSLSQSLMPFGNTVMMLALVIVSILVIISIPSLLVAGAKADRVGKAIVCELLRTVGILMVTIAATPTLFHIISKQTIPTQSLSSFIFVFALGILILLVASNSLAHVDGPSKAVPVAVFGYTFELLGILVTLAASILLGLSVLSSNSVPSGWEVPATALIIGLIFATIFSLHASNHRSGGADSFVSSLKKAVRKVARK